MVIASKDRPPGIPVACVLSLLAQPALLGTAGVLGCTVPVSGEPMGYLFPWYSLVQVRYLPLSALGQSL